MALIHIGFFSESLGMQVSCDVILPQKSTKLIGMESAVRGGGGASARGAADSVTTDGGTTDNVHPVLWLLHGSSDDHTIWQRRTSIERYAAPLGLAVVMPAVHLSSYSNMSHGGKFYDYVAHELPEKMRGFFPFSKKREDNFISGLSMGGSGCIKIGLANPEQYAAIGILSSASPQFRRTVARPEFSRRQELTYGGRDLTGTEEDVDASVRRILSGNLPKPRIYHAWGTEDGVCESARKTRDFFLGLAGNPFGYTYEEGPGAHTWDFWDEYIQHFLRFIDMKPIDGIRN